MMAFALLRDALGSLLRSLCALRSAVIEDKRALRGLWGAHQCAEAPSWLDCVMMVMGIDERVVAAERALTRSASTSRSRAISRLRTRATLPSTRRRTL